MDAPDAFQALFRHAGEAMFRLRRDGGIVDANEVACRRLGRDRAALCVLRLADLDPDHKSARWAALWAARATARTLTYPGRQRRADGTFFPVEISLTLLPGDSEVVAVVRDRSREVTAEAALREAQGFADRTIDAIGALIVVLDREGRILRFNAACQAATGWGASEVIGQPACDLFIPPAQREAFRSVFSHLCQGDFPIQHEHDWLRRDGSRVSIAWSSTCAVDAHGQVGFIIGTGMDISRQRRVEQTLAAIIDQTPNVAIQIYDRDGTIRMWNPASTRLYGWAADETTGRPASETVLRGQGLADLWAAFAGIERDGRQFCPAVFQMWHRDGHEVLALSTIFAIPGTEGRRQFVRMDVDVTERVRLQEALSVANAQLERRVLARTADLAAINSELESFSYSVSHDLRAPLRAIDGFATALAEHHAPVMPQQAQDLLARIRCAAARMGRLIDDLLDLSRISRRPVAPQPVDVSALARELASELTLANPGRRVEFHAEDGIAAHADPGLLRIAMTNLLGNAWKFTAKHPQARIGVSIEAQDGIDWIVVTDDGAGFDQHSADRLFTAFRRLHAAHEFEGSGIGLATVARVVNRHSGRLRACGEPGRGARFAMHLPPAPGNGS